MTESVTVRPSSPAAVVRARSLGDRMRTEPVAVALGAEVSDISLATIAEDRDLAAEVRQLLLKYKVLFFRDQDITAAEHVAFGRQFGVLEDHPVFEHHPDHPELALLYRGQTRKANENIFHTDVSWREVPSMGSILRCVECPPMGGDTIWVNMCLAYERLPDDLKERLEGLRAMHEMAHAFGGMLSSEERAEYRQKYPPQEHPVVRVHGETNEKILYVNQAFTTHFSNYKSTFSIRVGSDNAIQAAALMTYLFHQAAVPEYHVRLRWRPDTVAFWDNRSTQHYAVQDYFPQTRKMERVTIIGEKPLH